MSADFQPTDEQTAIVECDGAAYIEACPGAGKTRVLVERARKIRTDRTDRRGIAFLSFTNTAVSELQSRLASEGLVKTPAFPDFVGTFDSFVWQFLIAPLPIKGKNQARLIPDKEQRFVWAGEGKRPLPLKLFERENWTIKPREAKEIGFQLSDHDNETLTLYGQTAKKISDEMVMAGHLDFEDARRVALDRLGFKELGVTFARALSARFREIIVDEAQDCNEGDLEIMRVLCENGVPIKVVCDPNQAIFGFRGGIGDALPGFAAKVGSRKLPLTGNFRSSQHICNAVSALRPVATRGQSDKALGKHKDLPHPVHIVSYNGASITSAIGTKFRELILPVGVDTWDCPILSSTGSSAAKAAGMETVDGDAMTLRLARSVRAFHSQSNGREKASALRDLDRILLEISTKLKKGDTYHRYLHQIGETEQSRRAELLVIMRQLDFASMDAQAWLAHARNTLLAYAPPDKTISQKLIKDTKIAAMFTAEAERLPFHARTIHSVKGMQFPAVCVVLSNKMLSALRFIEHGTDVDSAEAARKIYVAASRAEQMLVIAAPKRQAQILERWFKASQAKVELHHI
jgi:DNA helicase-2/ATP-dependent DNA helicase PcrA